MQPAISCGPPNGYPGGLLYGSLPFPSEITHLTSDHGHLVPVIGQITCKLGVAGASRFIKIYESLVDKQNVHAI